MELLYALLGKACFIIHNVSEIHPCCCTYQQFVLSYCSMQLVSKAVSLKNKRSVKKNKISKHDSLLFCFFFFLQLRIPRLRGAKWYIVSQWHHCTVLCCPIQTSFYHIHGHFLVSLVRKSLSESVREYCYRKWKVNTQVMKVVGFPQRHVCQWVGKQKWYTNAMEDYSWIKRNKILTCIASWVNPENMLSEKSPT